MSRKPAETLVFLSIFGIDDLCDRTVAAMIPVIEGNGADEIQIK